MLGRGHFPETFSSPTFRQGSPPFQRMPAPPRSFPVQAALGIRRASKGREVGDTPFHGKVPPRKECPHASMFLQAGIGFAGFDCEPGRQDALPSLPPVRSVVGGREIPVYAQAQEPLEKIIAKDVQRWLAHGHGNPPQPFPNGMLGEGKRTPSRGAIF